MLKLLSQRPTALNIILITLISMLGALLIGMVVGSTPLSYQQLISILGVVGIVVIVIHKNGLETGYFIWIALFGLGYRTVKFILPTFFQRLLTGEQLQTVYFDTGATPVLKIHPLFVVLLLLLGILLVQCAINWRMRLVGQLPRLFLAFSLFWIWGWVRGLEYGNNWINMLVEVMPFLMIAPIFIVTASILEKRSLWKPTFIVLFGIGVIVASLGFLELVYPNIRNVIPGFIADNATIADVTQDGFLRANFEFWGGSGAAFIIVLSMPFAIGLWSWYKRPRVRAGIIIGLNVDVIGIYIAGWRSLWVLTLLMVIGLLLLRGSWIRALIFVVLIAVVYSFLPVETQTRAGTLLSDLQGNFQDNSAIVRLGRAEGAFQALLENPLGLGWSGVGLVHNDYLQITANLGIVPGILFILWYLSTLINISRVFYKSPDPLKHALVGAFMLCGGLFLTQPMIQLPQYVAPIWFVWALVQTKLGQITENEGSYDASKTDRARPDLQLPEASTPMP